MIIHSTHHDSLYRRVDEAWVCGVQKQSTSIVVIGRGIELDASPSKLSDEIVGLDLWAAACRHFESTRRYCESTSSLTLGKINSNFIENIFNPQYLLQSYDLGQYLLQYGVSGQYLLQ